MAANGLRLAKRLAKRSPFAAIALGLKTDCVHRPPSFGRFIEYIDHIKREQFVRHGQVKADVTHRLGPGDRLAKFIGRHLESEIPPIQSKLSQGGVVHRRRGGVPDGLAIHRAVSS